MKTDLNIRPMTPQEKIYAELQSSQISQQTGFIGVLVGNFNQQDKNQPMKWNILREPPIREAFWSEAQSVLKELRNTISRIEILCRNTAPATQAFSKANLPMLMGFAWIPRGIPI